MVKQILIVKHLFQRAERTLAESGPIASGLAISLLQDATELMLWTVAKELNPELTAKQQSFDALWEKVDEAILARNGERLIGRAKLIELNKARVIFKHYGVLPDKSDATRFLPYAHEFLAHVSNLVFWVDFDRVSLVELLSPGEIKTLLTRAREHHGTGQYREAVIETYKAQQLLIGRMVGLVPTVADMGNVASSFQNEYERQAIQGLTNYLFKYLDAMRTVVVKSILRISPNKTIGYFGVDGIRTMDGKWHINLAWSTHTEQQSAEFLEQVTDYAVAAQDVLGDLN